MTDGTAAENLFEDGLVDRFLEVYLPVLSPVVRSSRLRDLPGRGSDHGQHRGDPP